jgi:hypothetical protein
VIDRERGRPQSVNLSVKDRGKALADIWVKGSFTIGRGALRELLAFLAGYCAASGMDWSNKAMREDLIHCIVGRSVDILARDERFASLRQDFKEKYGLSQ